MIPLAAGALALLCLWFSWRALRRCQAIETAHENQGPPDELEDELRVRERNLELSLAKRNVQALRRAALFGGSGLAFWAMAAGGRAFDLRPAGAAFVAGLVAWAGCGALARRIGSLADSWRGAVNARSRRRRLGVDPTKRTG